MVTPWMEIGSTWIKCAMDPRLREDDVEKKSRPEAALSFAGGDYQMVTRSFGAKYILSPSFTPNAS